MPPPNKEIKLTQFQQEALIGSLLGDGHLSLNRKNASYKVCRSIKDEQYLKYEANIFNNLLAKRSFGTNESITFLPYLFTIKSRFDKVLLYASFFGFVRISVECELDSAIAKITNQQF